MSNHSSCMQGENDQTEYLPIVGDVLSIYISEMGKFSLLSEHEEKDLFSRIEKGDAKAREEMINANLRLAMHIAKIFRGKGLDFEDLIEEANVALIKAVDHYDLKLDTKFSSYVSTAIHRALRRAIVYAPTVHNPNYIDNLQGNWSKAAAEIFSEKKREGTDEEIRQRANIKDKQLKNMQKAGSIHVVSLSEVVTEGEGKTREQTLGDKLMDPLPMTDEEVEDFDWIERIGNFFKHMKPKDRKLLKDYYVKNLSMEKIGQRQKVKVTKSAIKQRLERCQTKLKNAMLSDPLFVESMEAADLAPRKAS